MAHLIAGIREIVPAVKPDALIKEVEALDQVPGWPKPVANKQAETVAWVLNAARLEDKHKIRLGCGNAVREMLTGGAASLLPGELDLHLISGQDNVLRLRIVGGNLSAPQAFLIISKAGLRLGDVFCLHPCSNGHVVGYAVRENQIIDISEAAYKEIELGFGEYIKKVDPEPAAAPAWITAIDGYSPDLRQLRVPIKASNLREMRMRLTLTDLKRQGINTDEPPATLPFVVAPGQEPAQLRLYPWRDATGKLNEIHLSSSGFQAMIDTFSVQDGGQLIAVFIDGVEYCWYVKPDGTTADPSGDHILTAARVDAVSSNTRRGYFSNVLPQRLREFYNSNFQFPAALIQKAKSFITITNKRKRDNEDESPRSSTAWIDVTEAMAAERRTLRVVLDLTIRLALFPEKPYHERPTEIKLLVDASQTVPLKFALLDHPCGSSMGAMAADLYMTLNGGDIPAPGSRLYLARVADSDIIMVGLARADGKSAPQLTAKDLESLKSAAADQNLRSKAIRQKQKMEEAEYQRMEDELRSGRARGHSHKYRKVLKEVEPRRIARAMLIDEGVADANVLALFDAEEAEAEAILNGDIQVAVEELSGQQEVEANAVEEITVETLTRKPDYTKSGTIVSAGSSGAYPPFPPTRYTSQREVENGEFNRELYRKPEIKLLLASMLGVFTKVDGNGGGTAAIYMGRAMITEEEEAAYVGFSEVVDEREKQHLRHFRKGTGSAFLYRALKAVDAKSLTFEVMASGLSKAAGLGAELVGIRVFSTLHPAGHPLALNTSKGNKMVDKVQYAARWQESLLAFHACGFRCDHVVETVMPPQEEKLKGTALIQHIIDQANAPLQAAEMDVDNDDSGDDYDDGMEEPSTDFHYSNGDASSDWSSDSSDGWSSESSASEDDDDDSGSGGAEGGNQVVVAETLGGDQK